MRAIATVLFAVIFIVENKWSSSYYGGNFEDIKHFIAEKNYLLLAVNLRAPQMSL